jgi:hypothetical protein
MWAGLLTIKISCICVFDTVGSTFKENTQILARIICASNKRTENTFGKKNVYLFHQNVPQATSEAEFLLRVEM